MPWLEPFSLVFPDNAWSTAFPPHHDVMHRSRRPSLCFCAHEPCTKASRLILRRCIAAGIVGYRGAIQYPRVVSFRRRPQRILNVSIVPESLLSTRVLYPWILRTTLAMQSRSRIALTSITPSILWVIPPLFPLPPLQRPFHNHMACSTPSHHSLRL